MDCQKGAVEVVRKLTGGIFTLRKRVSDTMLHEMGCSGRRLSAGEIDGSALNRGFLCDAGGAPVGPDGEKGGRDEHGSLGAFGRRDIRSEAADETFRV